MTKVIVKYNPFLPELSVLIDNKPLPKFSSIMSFKHKPFIEWCSRFFDRINSEVNDLYDLKLIATDFENEIFENLAKKSKKCNNYEFSYIENKRDVISRLFDLKSLGDNRKSTRMNVGIWAEDKSLAEAFIDLMNETGEYVEKPDSGLLSRQIPLVEMHLDKTAFIEDLLEKDLAIVLAQNDLKEESIDHLQRLGRSLFLINLADNTCFSGKQLNTFCYQVKGKDTVSCVEKIIEGVVLPQILSDREYQFEQIIGNNGISVRPETSDKLELICAIEGIYHLSFPEKTFVGRITRASVKTVPSTNTNQHYSLISRNGLLNVDGVEVEAVRSGMDFLELYCDEKPLPVATCEVSITDENYITDICFDRRTYNIAVGDSRKPEYYCYPDNSVNMDELIWEIKDTDIVDMVNGEIRGKKPGTTILLLKTNEASASVTINVLPHVVRIESTSQKIVLSQGEKTKWSYRLLPERIFGENTECFEEGSEKINSSNPKVAVYKGGFIEGKSPGSATIYITIPGSDIRHLCRVTVNRRGIF